MRLRPPSPESVSELIVLLAGGLGRERTRARLQSIEEQVQFARRHRLVDREDERELISMLLEGAKLADAVQEFRRR